MSIDNPPDNPPDNLPDTPTYDIIPQTGQLWGPVPVQLCLGLVFLTVGAIRRKGCTR